MASIALVVAQFYEELADELEATAHAAITARDAAIHSLCRVPGVYDTPLAADRLARRDDVDAVAVLGVVITGDTDHDQVVAH